MERFEQSRYRVVSGNKSAAILTVLRGLDKNQTPIHVEVEEVTNGKMIVSVIYENKDYDDDRTVA